LVCCRFGGEKLHRLNMVQHRFAAFAHEQGMAVRQNVRQTIDEAVEMRKRQEPDIFFTQASPSRWRRTLQLSTPAVLARSDTRSTNPTGRLTTLARGNAQSTNTPRDSEATTSRRWCLRPMATEGGRLMTCCSSWRTARRGQRHGLLVTWPWTWR
jgi:hypothetical protein